MNIREIFSDPVERRIIMVSLIVALQAREGIDTTVEQAEAAYDKVSSESTLDTTR